MGPQSRSLLLGVLRRDGVTLSWFLDKASVAEQVFGFVLTRGCDYQR